MKVPVEHEGLRLGQRREIAVDVLPATLHDRHGRIDEVVHRALQDVGLGHEVGVEDEHQFALGGAQSILQSARLESGPVGAAHVLDVQIGQAALQGRDLAQAEVLRLVGGIVEHLHLETITGVANGRDGIEQALGPRTSR